MSKFAEKDVLHVDRITDVLLFLRQQDFCTVFLFKNLMKFYLYIRRVYGAFFKNKVVAEFAVSLLKTTLAKSYLNFIPEK